MERADDNDIGYSNLFPSVPFLCAVSITCCMLILPGFVKTRVFILAFYVLWLVLGYLLILINMCIWRNNTRNIRVYSDIVARIWDVYPSALYVCIFCFNKFVWNMTRPEPSRKIYDEHTGTNRFDAFICIGFPLLWSPISLICSSGRYTIVEDLGPWPTSSISLASFFVDIVPIGLATMASAVFSVLTASNILRSQEGKRYGTHIRSSANYRELESTMVMKYLILSFIGVTETIFGFLWSLGRWLHEDQPWYKTLALDIRQVPLIYTTTRHDLLWHLDTSTIKGFLISLPLAGIQLFLLFGLGFEARQTYRSWLWTFVKFLKLPTIYGWTRRQAKRFTKLRVTENQNPENFTPFQPGDITLEPRTSILPPNNNSHAAPRKGIPVSLPAPIPKSFKRSQLRDNQRLPATSSERWRTFRKEMITPDPMLPGIYEESPPLSTQNGWRVMRKEPLPLSVIPMARK
ncbi:a-factor receptor [Serendipita sp. 411]|nr:a-factor receptor [Serendipita sp. 411]